MLTGRERERDIFISVGAIKDMDTLIFQNKAPENTHNGLLLISVAKLCLFSSSFVLIILTL